MIKRSFSHPSSYCYLITDFLTTQKDLSRSIVSHIFSSDKLFRKALWDVYFICQTCLLFPFALCSVLSAPVDFPELYVQLLTDGLVSRLILCLTDSSKSSLDVFSPHIHPFSYLSLSRSMQHTLLQLFTNTPNIPPYGMVISPRQTSHPS